MSKFSDSYAEELRDYASSNIGDYVDATMRQYAVARDLLIPLMSDTPELGLLIETYADGVCVRLTDTVPPGITERNFQRAMPRRDR